MSEIIKNIIAEQVSIKVNNQFAILVGNEKTDVCTFWKKDIKDKKAKNNALLLIDGLDTANKCGLLPSELLEAKNELLELLKEIHSYDGFVFEKDYKRVSELIQKHTQ